MFFTAILIFNCLTEDGLLEISPQSILYDEEFSLPDLVFDPTVSLYG